MAKRKFQGSRRLNRRQRMYWGEYFRSNPICTPVRHSLQRHRLFSKGELMHLVFILKLKVSTCLEDKKRLKNAVFIFFGPEAECKLTFYYFKEDTMSITCAKQIFTLFSRRDDLLLKVARVLFCLLGNSPSLIALVSFRRSIRAIENFILKCIWCLSRFSDNRN